MTKAEIKSTLTIFEYYKALGEKTFAQLSDEQLFYQANEESNSIGILVKHLWGNMLSRWTNFLTEDGEKEWRARDAEFESIKQTIIETALEHHLVSRYTSLVAVDVTPVRPKDQELDSHAIPTHLPKGWDHNKVFGQQFPATATDARMNFIIGLFLLLLATLVHLTRRHDSYV